MVEFHKSNRRKKLLAAQFQLAPKASSSHSFSELSPGIHCSPFQGQGLARLRVSLDNGRSSSSLNKSKCAQPNAPSQ